MAKHRILQVGESEFYPQEKPSIFHPWAYIDNRFCKYVWPKRSSNQSKCVTLGQALAMVASRKEFLKKKFKYPIIHKVD